MLEPLPAEAPSWPSAKIVSAATRGIREVLWKVEGASGPVLGLRCSLPWVAWVGRAVICTRCQTAAENPPPPAAQAGPGEPPKSLFVPGSLSYAQYLLATLLHPFAQAHAGCELEILEADNGS